MLYFFRIECILYKDRLYYIYCLLYLQSVSEKQKDVRSILRFYQMRVAQCNPLLLCMNKNVWLYRCIVLIMKASPPAHSIAPQPADIRMPQIFGKS